MFVLIKTKQKKQPTVFNIAIIHFFLKSLEFVFTEFPP